MCCDRDTNDSSDIRNDGSDLVRSTIPIANSVTHKVTS